MAMVFTRDSDYPNLEGMWLCTVINQMFGTPQPSAPCPLTVKNVDDDEQ